MNNIHKVIFNKNTQQFVVVSELAKSAGKTKAVSVDSVDIVSLLQNFSEKRPLVDVPLSTSGQILVKNCISSTASTHKRLGDGFYEQRLINEQINQLTGRRFLEGYNNDLEQYKALMNNGIKYAEQFNLSVGVGLTAKQMSELTTDMVWLVNKEVTLADGSKVTALVPQVYLVARNSDITSFGAVISANEIVGNVDNVQNSGVIAGRDLTRLHSEQLENRGTILGESVDLSAKQTLINLGGKIEAMNNLSLYV